MSKILLGPHLLKATPEALKWAIQAPTIKIVGVECIKAFYTAPQNSSRVYRKYIKNQNIFSHGADLARYILSDLGAYRHPNLYIELLNECGKSAVRQQIYQINEAAHVLHAEGIKLIGPCWSTGDYNESDWRLLVDSTRGNLDAIAVHCYWAGKGFTKWNAFRFAEYWKPGDPKVFITECGRDRVRDGDNGEYIGNCGWINDGLSAEEYERELIAYNNALLGYNYVLGAHVFSAGAGDSQDWNKYNTDSLNLSPLYSIPSNIPAGGISMTLQTEYPAQFAEWVKAGGIDNNFRAHLLGTGSLKPVKEDLKILAGNAQAATTQLKNVIEKFPF